MIAFVILSFSVFNQGEEGTSWYIILKGSVNVVIYGKVSSAIIILLLCLFYYCFLGFIVRYHSQAVTVTDFCECFIKFEKSFLNCQDG